ncbi:putative reverse transcriptase domain-containing protein [Tanacetum coccineum]
MLVVGLDPQSGRVRCGDVCNPDKDGCMVREFFSYLMCDNVKLSCSKEDHEVHLKLVMELLKKEKLFAKFSKCEVWLQEVHFLGHVVNNNDIHVDPSKIEAMKNWKAPKTLSEIRSFLGLAVYYRRVDQEEAFQTLKDNLCNAPILSLPDRAEDFVVYYDASNQGLGSYIRPEGVNMRQRRWIELFSDYDCDIRYYPKEATIVADALSRKERVKPR